MRSAASASRRAARRASASEYTATVSMPIARHVRIDAARDFAAIGDEDAPNHRSRSSRPGGGGRFSRNARMPSWPSGDTRWVAMASTVSASTSAGRRPYTSVEQSLGRARSADGAALRNSCDVAFDRRDRAVRPRRPRVHQADLLRARGRESRAGQAQLARGRQPDLPHHVRRDHRGQDAEHDLREPEHRVVGGDDHVADGREAGAAAERRAVDAADERHGQTIERQEHRRRSPRIGQVLLAREAEHPATSTGRRRRRRTPRRRPAARRRAPNRPSAGRSRRTPSVRAIIVFVERVANVRPVERDGRDADRDESRMCTHAITS